MLDVDHDDDAERAALNLLGVDDLPLTPTVRTGRGTRLQLYFADPGGLAKKARDGFELRVGEHQCILPPSEHPETGRRYEWLPGRAPWEVDLAELPLRADRLLQSRAAERLVSAARTDKGRHNVLRPCGARSRTARSSNRDPRLPQRHPQQRSAQARLTRRRRRAGRGRSTSGPAGSRGPCGLPEREAIATIESGLGAGLKQPRRPSAHTAPEPTRASESVESVTDSQGGTEAGRTYRLSL